jgi:uncharacterized protein (DUF58 family)
MQLTEIIQKVKKLEIKTKRLVAGVFAGEYHSIFKGQGISFAEVRAYQIGDDIRSIDWRITAKMRAPYIKLFEEERELTIFLMIDVSASGNFGSTVKTKRELAAEIASILGFAALKNNDRVGLILFSDKVEKYIPAKKGRNHLLAIIKDIFAFKAQNSRTSISAGLDYFLKIHKKRTVVFLISDFLDEKFEKKLSVVARKHQIIPIMIRDPKETELPKAGLLSLTDPETGETLIINTHKKEIRDKFHNIKLSQILSKERMFKKLKLDLIQINDPETYFEPMQKYFRKKARQNR